MTRTDAPTGDWARRLVSVTTSRPWVVIGAALLLAAAGAVAAPLVEVDARLEALLPEGTPQLEALAEARRRYGAEAPLYLVVRSSEPAVNRRLARSLLDRARRWPEVVWAIAARDPSFFRDRALLYLDAQVLEDIAVAAEERLEWERCERSPLCANVVDEPPVPDLGRVERELEALPEVRTLRELMGGGDLLALDAGSAEQGARTMGELCSPDGTVCVVQLVLRGDPDDARYARQAVAEARAILSAATPADAPADLSLAVRGRYGRYATEQDAVERDLGRVAAITAVLVFLVLLAQFRGLRALALLAVPLAVGAGLTALAVALFAGPLNVVSAATLVILFGVGVDFGIHLVTCYGGLRERMDARLAIEETLRSLLPSLVLAAVTTSAAFAALAAGRFAGLGQVGILCALGIALTFVSFVLLFPPLVIVTERAAYAPLVRRWGGAWPASWPRPNAALAILAVGAVAGVLGLSAVGAVEFEYDLRELGPEPDGRVPGTGYGDALLGTARSPTLMLADDPAALERAAEGLRRMYPDGLVRGAWLITPETFVPPDQERRLRAIARLRATVQEAERFADDGWRERIVRVRGALAVETPIGPDDLPPWVRQSLSERDGSFGTIGIVYEGGSTSDARRMELRAERLRQWQQRFPGVRFASQGAVLGEITSQLRADTPRIVGLALAALLVATWAVGRSFRSTAIVAAPVLLATGVTAAIMSLAGIRVNLYNLVILPLAFGVGVDGAVYVTFRILRSGAPLAWEDLPGTARAVLGSTLTTLAAFGSLALSESRGLASLGQLAIIALLATLLANLVWLPALLRRIERARGSSHGRNGSHRRAP